MNISSFPITSYVVLPHVFCICLERYSCFVYFFFFFFKQKTAYEKRISDWSSDVFSSDLAAAPGLPLARLGDRRDEALGQAERRADALAELPGDLQHLPDAAVEEGPGGGEALRPVVQPVQQRRGVDAGQQRPRGGEVVVGRAVAGGVQDGSHRAVEGGESGGRVLRQGEEGESAAHRLAVGGDRLEATAHAGSDLLAHFHGAKVEALQRLQHAAVAGGAERADQLLRAAGKEPQHLARRQR